MCKLWLLLPMVFTPLNVSKIKWLLPTYEWDSNKTMPLVLLCLSKPIRVPTGCPETYK